MFPVYIIFGVIFAVTVVVFIVRYTKTGQTTSYTEGTVISAEERVVRTEIERREETVLKCTYVVRGHQYDLEHVIRGRIAKAFPAGREVKVWYNPSEPSMAMIKKI